jgi:hypothetical protein
MGSIGRGLLIGDFKQLDFGSETSASIALKEFRFKLAERVLL